MKLLKNMTKLRDNKRVINEIELKTEIFEIDRGGILFLEIGANNNKEGDAGHGGRFFIRMNGEGIWYETYSNPQGGREFTFRSGGEWEINMFIDVFRFIADYLEEANK